MPKTVLIISQKGGVGKSFLADELAFSLDRTHTPYTYYDMDEQGGSIHHTTEREDALITIVDTPGAITDDLPEWIKSADIIVIPVRASMRDQPAFERTREAAQTYAKNKPIMLVQNQINRFKANTMFRDWLIETKKDNELILEIPASESVPRAGMEQVSVVEFAPRSKIADNIRQLANVVREKVGLTEEPVPQRKTRKRTSAANTD